MPTRLFHVAPGGHHGWRLKGFLRSWPRPSYDPGTVNILADLGRGSPTGVVCYRHRQFPRRFRDGLFLLDWTFGKVYFVTLRPEGASYRAGVEVFLEPTGASGFAPTDAVVAPDGSLLISIGGRKTRRAVYRIEYVGKKKEEEDEKEKEKGAELDGVLSAPQPLDAWSRAIWTPVARKLGRESFLKAISDQTRPEAERIRAVEVVTELFGSLDQEMLASLEKTAPDSVRRRVAWSLGRRPGAADVRDLVDLDAGPGTVVAALDAWNGLGKSANVETRLNVLALRRLYQPVFEHVLKDHPELSARLLDGGGDLAGWSRRLARVDWSTGDAGRGAKLFRDRGCQTCHAGPRSLGPDLNGVTDRLSRDDLFTAIVAPSLDVSPLYRLTLVETRSGQVDSGLVAFESADGLILQTGATTTVRVATPEIVSRHVGNRSLMPDGLLQGLDDRDLADLDRYLRAPAPRTR